MYRCRGTNTCIHVCIGAEVLIPVYIQPCPHCGCWGTHGQVCSKWECVLAASTDCVCLHGWWSTGEGLICRVVHGRGDWFADGALFLLYK